MTGCGESHLLQRSLQRGPIATLAKARGGEAVIHEACFGRSSCLIVWMPVSWAGFEHQLKHCHPDLQGRDVRWKEERLMELPLLVCSQETPAQRQRAGCFLKATDKPGVQHGRPCCLKARSNPS